MRRSSSWMGRALVIQSGSCRERRMQGPVWPSPPQTPQAAEQMAMIRPAFLLQCKVEIFSDCLGAV
eukprot:3289235-Pyramimonas_sp.AAC.1